MRVRLCRVRTADCEVSTDITLVGSTPSWLECCKMLLDTLLRCLALGLQACPAVHWVRTAGWAYISSLAMR